jgi:bis(5'-nucleosyl)-tetraphosphatase (symmetrical)
LQQSRRPLQILRFSLRDSNAELFHNLSQKADQAVAVYLIGDIQGCYTPLSRALEQVRFDPKLDQLWAVGDLINRGGADLKVVRLLRSLGSAFRSVLGNHDLNFLAVAYGVKAPKRSDTVHELLDAPERQSIVDWFRAFPLAFYNEGVLVVHAGVPPDWTLEQTLSRSREIEAQLSTPDPEPFLRSMYGDNPNRFVETLDGADRARAIVNALTRLRFCTPAGALDFAHKLGPETAPTGMLPWFAHAGRLLHNTPIAFGHWAHLNGEVQADNLMALDTGCVWGRKLTLLRLNDRQRFACDCA